MLLSVVGSLLVIIAAIFCGSVFIAPYTGLQTIFCALFRPDSITDQNAYTIIFSLRIPRVLLAFLVGASTAAAGAAVQTCLRNHLASPFTLGASAGAALGAGMVMITGLSLPLLGSYTLPMLAILSSLAAILLVTAWSSAVDRQLSGNTIVLCGMVLSLFFSALLTTFGALNRESLQRITLWQLGSFALRGYDYVLLLLPFALLGVLLLLRFAGELDIMSFGDEHARSLGVAAGRVRAIILVLSAVLTGASVAVCGVIGFVDLVAPHVVRRLFGSRHTRVIPLSALFGGTLMVCADLVARVVISPAEMPVGAITALIGAPFFAFVFFAERKQAGHV